MISVENLRYYLYDSGLRFDIRGLRSTGRVLRMYSEASAEGQAQIARDYSLSLPNLDNYMEHPL